MFKVVNTSHFVCQQTHWIWKWRNGGGILFKTVGRAMHQDIRIGERSIAQFDRRRKMREGSSINYISKHFRDFFTPSVTSLTASPQLRTSFMDGPRRREPFSSSSSSSVASSVHPFGYSARGALINWAIERFSPMREGRENA